MGGHMASRQQRIPFPFHMGRIANKKINDIAVRYRKRNNQYCKISTPLGYRTVNCERYRENQMIRQRAEWLMNALKEPEPTFDINPYLNMNKNNYSDLVRRLFKDLGA